MNEFIVIVYRRFPHWLLSAITASPLPAVNNVAFVFRILAFAIFAPLLLLAFLDITAYVIARTLQAPADRQRAPVPGVAITNISGKYPQDASDFSTPGATVSHLGRPPAHGEPVSFFHFATDEALSGVGLFSPAPSRPPSPSVSRLSPSTGLSPPIDDASLGREPGEIEIAHEQGEVLRRRTGVQAPLDG